MQWGDLGDGIHPSRYLPEDPDPDRPTVADQRDDPDSLLTFVREAIALRRGDPRLSAHDPVEVRTTAYPFTYVRSGSLLVALNPSRTPRTVPDAAGRIRHGYAARLDGGTLHLDAFGCAVVELDQTPAAAPAASDERNPA
jgi:maltose alpha-D-glucosyltransferase/alpha-amylase